jgi:hypothetical protein
MHARIGNAAGVIWRYLNEHGDATIRRLRKETKLSDQVLLMALGWLAREDKLVLTRAGSTLKISLKGSEAPRPTMARG